MTDKWASTHNPAYPFYHVMTQNHIPNFISKQVTALEFYNALRAIWIPSQGPGSFSPKVGMFESLSAV